MAGSFDGRGKVDWVNGGHLKWARAVGKPIAVSTAASGAAIIQRIVVDLYYLSNRQFVLRQGDASVLGYAPPRSAASIAARNPSDPPRSSISGSGSAPAAISIPATAP